MTAQTTPAQIESAEASTEQSPLQVRHGRRIFGEISKTHADVVATVANTETLLALLTPDSDAENPVLEVLEKILMGQRQQQAALERIEKRLEQLHVRMTQLERARR